MKTQIRLNKQTGQVTIDVLDGVGQQCREKNDHIYSAIRRQLRDPSQLQEDCKPEMQLPEIVQTEEQPQVNV